MFGLFQKKPEVCNVLGDSITLRLTAEQTDGKYTVAEFATPGGVESVFKSRKANQKDLSDMGKVVEIVTKEEVNIAG